MATSDLIRTIGQAIIDALSPRRRSSRRQTRRAPSTRRTGTRSGTRTDASGYPGDFTGRPVLSYDPHPGRVADPGEVVWTWVPFEEDHSQGKDRPVLVISRDGHWLLGLPMTSKDHDRDARQEASEGRYWVEVGSGSWDSSGRVSEVRVDRIIRVDPEKIRRLSAPISRERFERVADGVRRHR
ncbi:MAG: type II toxin-antitoxin system PemK/MazF family toxin [Actinobacteria bacterium]|nr:type II toxin-antitoxin system PemK/MazF family toxin [Actinomycetota bacterium]